MANKVISKNIKKKPKPNVLKNYLSELRTELEKAASGLIHYSESEYPYQFFTLPPGNERDEAGLTAQEFLKRIGLSEGFITYDLEKTIDQFIEERKFDEFFPAIDELADWEGKDPSDPEVVSLSNRYRNMEEILKKYLHDLKVFCVGKAEVKCFIAGLDKFDNAAGLSTTSIET